MVITQEKKSEVPYKLYNFCALTFLNTGFWWRRCYLFQKLCYFFLHERLRERVGAGELFVPSNWTLSYNLKILRNVLLVFPSHGMWRKKQYIYIIYLFKLVLYCGTGRGRRILYGYKIYSMKELWTCVNLRHIVSIFIIYGLYQI